MSLSRSILAVLAESPLPVRTPDLIDLVAAGRRNARALVWDCLRGLHAAGLVRRAGRGTARHSRLPVTLWRLA